MVNTFSKLSTKQKIILGISAASVLGGIIWYLFYGRWSKFVETNWSNGILYGEEYNSLLGLVVDKETADKFKAGDTVKVRMSKPELNDTYDGEHTVKYVGANREQAFKDKYTIIIDTNYVNGTKDETGLIRLIKKGS